MTPGYLSTMLLKEKNTFYPLTSFQYQYPKTGLGGSQRCILVKLRMIVENWKKTETPDTPCFKSKMLQHLEQISLKKSV